MSKSLGKNLLLEVASLSMRLSRTYVSSYSHRNSPKKFTQEQLLTCLIIKAYLKTTYRGVIEILETSDALRKRIGLEKLPHYTALNKFSARSDILQIVDCLLLELVQQFDPGAEEAAIDSTGLEASSASAHYQTRSKKQRKKFIKVSVCVLIGSLLPSSAVFSWGPSNDKKEAGDVLVKAHTAHHPKRLFADAGYDAEWVHEYCRDDWQVESVIKPAIHRSDGGMNGKYRSQMTAETLDEKNYGRRWQRHHGRCLPSGNQDPLKLT